MRLAIGCLVLVGCAGEIRSGAMDAGASEDAPAAVDAVAAMPDAALPGPLLGTFQLTYYWVTTEEEFSGPADTEIFDDACVALAIVPAAFAQSLALEGTGRLADGRMLNYEGACPCAFSPCFFELAPTHPWGMGVGARPLVPFRSVAADLDLLAAGDPLYLEELDGVAMPGDPPWGAFVHDGCVRVDDTGGSIIGMHLDLFAALRVYYLNLDGTLGLPEVTVRAGGDRCTAP